LLRRSHITHGQYFSIYRKATQNKKALALKNNINGLVLLAGLIKTFPCKK